MHNTFPPSSTYATHSRTPQPLTPQPMDRAIFPSTMSELGRAFPRPLSLAEHPFNGTHLSPSFLPHGGASSAASSSEQPTVHHPRDSLSLASSASHLQPPDYFAATRSSTASLHHRTRDPPSMAVHDPMVGPCTLCECHLLPLSFFVYNMCVSFIFPFSVFIY